MQKLGSGSKSKKVATQKYNWISSFLKMTYITTTLFLFIICSLIRAAQDYIPVTRCPSGAKEWKAQEEKKKSQDQTSYLHVCAVIQNWSGHYGEICTLLQRYDQGIYKQFIFLKISIFKNENKITFLFALKLILEQHSL